MRIRDGKISDAGWKKFGIRDKHPGSATLVTEETEGSGTLNA
jgi:hypothetical protein